MQAHLASRAWPAATTTSRSLRRRARCATRGCARWAQRGAREGETAVRGGGGRAKTPAAPRARRARRGCARRAACGGRAFRPAALELGHARRPEGDGAGAERRAIARAQPEPRAGGEPRARASVRARTVGAAVGARSGATYARRAGRARRRPIALAERAAAQAIDCADARPGDAPPVGDALPPAPILRGRRGGRAERGEHCGANHELLAPAARLS